MENINLKEYVDVVKKYLVEEGLLDLGLQAEQHIFEELQKIVDEHISIMAVDQLRILISIEITRMVVMEQLSLLSSDEMEIEIEKLCERVVKVKRKYLQTV